MIKFLLNKTFLIFILLILLVANLALLYFLFFKSSSSVTITNKSTYYRLTYHPSNEFSRFMTDISTQKSTNIKTLSSVQALNIVLIDREAPDSPPPIGTIPLTFTVDVTPKTTSTATITIGIDKKDADKFDLNINDMLLKLLLRQLYTTTHPGTSTTQKEAVLHEYEVKILSEKPQPFELNKL